MTLPFSPYIERNGFIFLSGQIPLTDEGKLLEGTIDEQTRLIMTKLEAILNSAGVSFANVVKTTIYLKDMEFSPAVSATYASYFTNEFPAREMICVKGLPFDANIEISMIASK